MITIKATKRVRRRMPHWIPKHAIRIVTPEFADSFRSQMQETVRLSSICQFKSARKRGVMVNVLTACLALAAVSWSQNSKPSQPPTQALPPAAQTSANPLPAVQVDGSTVLHHLNQLISWYRHATGGIPSVGMPSDAIYQDNTQNLAA